MAKKTYKKITIDNLVEKSNGNQVEVQGNVSGVIPKYEGSAFQGFLYDEKRLIGIYGDCGEALVLVSPASLLLAAQQQNGSVTLRGSYNHSPTQPSISVHEIIYKNLKIQCKQSEA